MKRLLLCALAVAAAGLCGLLPANQKDVGDLLPVRTLVVAREGDILTLDGGEDLHGEGADWSSAMDDLRATAPGDAFFGTMGQIVLTEDALAVLPDVLREKEVRPAARVYAGTGKIDPETASDFLEAKKGGVTVQTLWAASLEGREETLPRLDGENGRYHLYAG